MARTNVSEGVPNSNESRNSPFSKRWRNPQFLHINASCVLPGQRATISRIRRFESQTACMLIDAFPYSLQNNEAAVCLGINQVVLVVTYWINHSIIIRSIYLLFIYIHNSSLIY